jgi:hypothetical protein
MRPSHVTRAPWPPHQSSEAGWVGTGKRSGRWIPAERDGGYRPAGQWICAPSLPLSGAVAHGARGTPAWTRGRGAAASRPRGWGGWRRGRATRGETRLRGRTRDDETCCFFFVALTLWRSWPWWPGGPSICFLYGLHFFFLEPTCWWWAWRTFV